MGEDVAVVVQAAVGAVGAKEAIEMQQQAFDVLYLYIINVYAYPWICQLHT